MDTLLEQYFDFSIMGDNFDRVLEGFWYTVKLALIASVAALAWGLVLALIRQLPGRFFRPIRGLTLRGFARQLPSRAAGPMRGLTIGYIDVFRGVPIVLVMLYISGSFGVLATEGVIPEWLGIPRWFGQPDNFWYGVFALTLCYGAYMAEVFRAGIEAIPQGQTEAARSLGMSHGQAMRYVIVPQAVRKVFAPLLNDVIALYKDTALVAFIGLTELTQVGRDVQSETFNSSVLTLGALFYLALTIPLARIVDRLIAGQQLRFQRGMPAGGSAGSGSIG
jgi:polar amino acid transport system permease protein